MLRLTVLLGAFTAFLGHVAAIIGGAPVRSNEYEYTVAISQPGMNQRSNTNFICDGVLVGEDRVITLAECVAGLEASDISIRTGMSNLTFQNIDASKIITHPQYNSTSFAYDIAMIQLSVPITNITSAPLAPNTTTYPTGNAILLGWGSASNNTQAESKMLQSATVPIVDADTCAKVISSCYALDSCQHFCTASKGKGEGYGDAGGPVVDSEGLVLGLISGNPICAQPDHVALELSLAHLHDWIFNTDAFA